jgi:hypothetical protein
VVQNEPEPPPLARAGVGEVAKWLRFSRVGSARFVPAIESAMRRGRSKVMPERTRIAVLIVAAVIAIALAMLEALAGHPDPRPSPPFAEAPHR